MIIPKVEKPIKIRLGENKAILYLADGKTLDLHKEGNNGCLWAEGSGHYGIHIICDLSPDMPLETVYFTQCEIDAINLDKSTETLYIWERNKYPSAWKFNNQGKLLERATYAEYWDPTREFILEHEAEIKEKCNTLPTTTNTEDYIDVLITEANRANNMQLNIGKNNSTPVQTPTKYDGGKQ